MKQNINYYLRFLTLSAVLSLYIACDDDESIPNPTADFSVETNELDASFSSESTDAVALEWDFGDGQTSKKAWPVHTYNNDGDYSVTLKAIGVEGTESKMITKNITITQINPLAGFSYELDSKTVTFTNTTQRGVSYVWDFGDGGSSTEENPTYTYAETGEYTVTLTATGIDGSVPSSHTTTLAVGIDVFVEVAVENTDFSLPGTGKLSNWGNVPGWSTDTQAADSGIENQEGDGNWFAYRMSSDPQVYQLSEHTIASGEQFKVNVQAWDTWNSSQFTLTIYYDTGDGSRNVLATQTFDITGDRTVLELLSAATEASVGAKLGIAFESVSTDGGDGWSGFDNVQLFVK